MKRTVHSFVIVFTAALLLLSTGCGIFEHGIDHYLPYTKHLVGTEYYLSGTGRSAEFAAQIMPELSELTAAESIEYQYDYKVNGIDNAECSYLTIRFREEDYEAFVDEITADALQRGDDQRPYYYMLPKDASWNEVAFCRGGFRFDPQYAVEQKVDEKSYLRLIGLDDERHTVLYLYLYSGVSATSMSVDYLLEMDFFSNYPW